MHHFHIVSFASCQNDVKECYYNSSPTVSILLTFVVSCADNSDNNCNRRVRMPTPSPLTNVSSIQLTSPHYPKPYPSYSLCTWRVLAGRRSKRRPRLQMTFDDLDLEQTDLCRFDFVEVTPISGRKSVKQTTQRYCGTSSNTSVPLAPGLCRVDCHVVVIV